MKRREFIGAGATVLDGTLAGRLGRAGPIGDEVTETVSRSFGAPAVQEIHVWNEIGNVLITAQGRGGVDVRVLKRSVRGQAGLDDLADETLTVDTALDRRALASIRQTLTTDVTITVPETLRPEVAAITSKIGDVTLLETRGDTGSMSAPRVGARPPLGILLTDDVECGDGERVEETSLVLRSFPLFIRGDRLEMISA